ncbi:MAG: TlpA family protein disulfide reductase [Deltaproteobacteria bacterium]|nr:TlpA family protein disulfide reductase [Deltaproteobacteria bacterium]
MTPQRAIAVLLAVSCAATPVTQDRAPGSVLGNIEASADLDGAPVGTSTAPATVVVVFASWCQHCKVELAVLASLRAAHPRIRILGISYKPHEEYAARGSETALRAYVAASAPWLRVIAADDALFTALGRPPKVPTIYVFDHAGALAAQYDRRQRRMPDAEELGALLVRLGG